mgnify:FL=1
MLKKNSAGAREYLNFGRVFVYWIIEISGSEACGPFTANEIGGDFNLPQLPESQDNQIQYAQ